MSVRLDTVCDIIMGQAPAGDEYNDKGDGLPLLAGAGDFKNGRPLAKKFTRVITKECVAGDIVIGIRASIGDKVVADRPYCLGRGVAVIRPRGQDMIQRYLWHWMTAVRSELERKAKGATFKQVNRADIGELELTLPSIEEQRRIAAVLDRAEELRAKRRAAIALLDHLPQAIFLEMFGDSKSKKKWPILNLDDFCTTGSGGTPARRLASRYYEGGIIPWVKSGELRESMIYETEESITFEAVNESSAKLVPENAILLAMYGATVGRLAILGVPAATNQAVCNIVPKPDLAIRQFVFHALQQQVPKMISMAVGGAQPNISQGLIRRIRLPLPPLEIQEQFAEKARLVSEIKNVHIEAHTDLNALFTTLQSIAFSQPNFNHKQVHDV